MTQVTLVRHGQANTDASNEADYDRLSDLGHMQARWLGEYFVGSGHQFSRVYCGSMQRHKETADSLGAARFGEIKVDARLNEFPYFSVAQAYLEQTQEPAAETPEDFAKQFSNILTAWSEGQLEDVTETYADFQTRVSKAIASISNGDGPALVITSGGLIGTVMRHTLTLNASAWAQMCLSIYNTSVHLVHPFLQGQRVGQFNAVPHLDTAERRHALTHL